MDRLHEHKWQTPLLAEIAGFIASGQEDEECLCRLTLDLARLHYERDPVYGKLCDLRGVHPDEARSLMQLPAVPAEAFKRTEMHIAPDSVTCTFTTSGTTGGEARKGTACFSEDDLFLMDAAIDVNATRCLFPDHAERRTLILVLAPSPDLAPQMIMAYGMKRLVDNYGLEDSAFLVGQNGLDFPSLLERLENAANEGTPATLIGASFGFVHLFDAFEERGLRFALPHASRVMDAGGFKGKSKEVRREDMVAAFGEYLGIPAGHCVNLLGLTEFASQFYDDAVAAAFDGRPARKGKQNAPWTRTWAVDPETLEPLPHGKQGILRHLDLANGGHPFLVQTDDLGVTSDEGFEVIGRVGGAESRGCSISVDELMGGGQERR